MSDESSLPEALSFFKPQLTFMPHFRIVSLAVFVRACLSPALDLRVEKNDTGLGDRPVCDSSVCLRWGVVVEFLRLCRPSEDEGSSLSKLKWRERERRSELTSGAL
jgi:hypothetical protein